jgi:hypothetical protein
MEVGQGPIGGCSAIGKKMMKSSLMINNNQIHMQLFTVSMRYSKRREFNTTVR